MERSIIRKITNGFLLFLALPQIRDILKKRMDIIEIPIKMDFRLWPFNKRKEKRIVKIPDKRKNKRRE